MQTMQTLKFVKKDIPRWARERSRHLRDRCTG